MAASSVIAQASAIQMRPRPSATRERTGARDPEDEEVMLGGQHLDGAHELLVLRVSGRILHASSIGDVVRVVDGDDVPVLPLGPRAIDEGVSRVGRQPRCVRSQPVIGKAP